MTVQQMVLEALKLTGIGFGSVFIVLALFFFMIKAIMRLFPEKEKS